MLTSSDSGCCLAAHVSLGYIHSHLSFAAKSWWRIKEKRKSPRHQIWRLTRLYRRGVSVFDRQQLAGGAPQGTWQSKDHSSVWTDQSHIHRWVEMLLQLTSSGNQHYKCTFTRKRFFGRSFNRPRWRTRCVFIFVSYPDKKETLEES